MTSLIKNQILKHLTKFFKYLQPEQLQLSAFKGSCDLSDLQLEEKVLMELLSFPAWIRINKALCDQLSIRIPWTKIKSVPIQMNLNEVTVEVEVCEEFRDIQLNDEDDINQLTHLINSSQAPGKYGFVDRVIDGITVTVNNILISFKSKLMTATFNLSRVSLESRCPNWKPGELSLTRIKDPKRGELLLFKVVEWQTMRLEAKCLTDPNQAPLRLITNHAQCRLTIKKDLEDCSVKNARIFVIFEDILWVLTFAQFTSATSFVEYIFKLIKRSPMSNKASLLDNQSLTLSGQASQSSANNSSSFSGLQSNAPPILSPLNTSMHITNRPEKPSMLTGNLSSASLMEQKFLCYDLIETSLHLYIDKIDAHLYDDIEMDSARGGSRVSGGALQTTLDQIQVDCYPYSRANSDRKHWYRWFDPSPSSRRQWIRGHFTEFDLMRMCKNKAKKTSNKTDDSKESPNLHESTQENSDKTQANPQTKPIALDDQLLSLVVLVKIKDYCMHCVATNNSLMHGTSRNKFIETDKDYHMPTEMPAFYLELNYYYYFDAINRMMVYENVPEPLSFIHLSPTKLLFDSPTLVFLNSFQVNLSKAFVHLNDLFPEETTAPKIHCRIEILMPQVILPAKSHNDQPPNIATSSLLVKSGKVTLSSSIYDREILCKLLNTIEKLRESPSQPINFGSSNDTDSKLDKTNSKGDAYSDDWTRVWNASIINGLQDDDSPQNQVWAVQYEPVWIDFMNYDHDKLSNRLEPIVEPVDAYAFVHLDLSSQRLKGDSSDVTPTSFESMKKRDIISILVSIPDKSILANMDKVQFGFLQRLGMHVEKLIQQIKEDCSSVIQLETVVEDTLEINLTAYIRDIKARLILDKKIGTQSYTDGVRDGPTQEEEGKTSSANKTLPPLNISMNQKDIFISSTSDTKSAPVSNQSTGFYSGIMSNISGTFTSKSKEEGYTSCAYTKQSFESPVNIDSIDTASNEDLDDCVEVADDASCLIMIDTKGDSIAHDASKQPELASSQSDALDVSCGSRRHIHQDSPSRSIGKSPIEESLLINLDEIEQSSNLFAKMDLKSPSSATNDEGPSQNNDQKDLGKGEGKGKTTKPEVNPHKPQVQQQDIETESISYLELSMSRLMVRRITETKRRQKP